MKIVLAILRLRLDKLGVAQGKPASITLSMA